MDFMGMLLMCFSMELKCGILWKLQIVDFEHLNLKITFLKKSGNLSNKVCTSYFFLLTLNFFLV